MKAVFVAAQERLIAQVPALKMIDFDLGQTDQASLPPLDFPACLMSFGESPFNDLQGRTQEATITLMVRLVFRVFERTSSVVQSQYRAIGLQHMDIIEQVKWALHGFHNDDFSAISHRGFSTEPSPSFHPELRIYNLTFELRLCVAPPVPQFVSWSDAGGQGTGPDLCIEDGQGNPIIN
jgi:hypothetical protein